MAGSSTASSTGLFQSLLKRNPAYTRDQFSAHWLQHGKKVVPWALEIGVTYYAQIHNPVVSPSANASLPDGLDLSEWDGAAEMGFSVVPAELAKASASASAPTTESREQGSAASVSTPPAETAAEAKTSAYYRAVILPDERAFLQSEALQHLRRLEPGVVTGDRVVIIENGKACVEFEEEKMAWEAFQPQS